MTNKSIISIKTLHKMLICDFESGLLIWRKRPDSTFISTDKRPASTTAKMWNSRMAGRAAFTYVDDTGYMSGTIANRKCRAHIIVYALYHDVWPLHQIDHINGIKTDNRIANLRDVPQTINARNACMSSANTSGVTGVYFNKLREKWVAQISYSGKHHSLGLFTDRSAAIFARKEAEALYGYSQRHGTMA